MYLTKAMEDYLRHSQDELKALIRDLCAIPAPPTRRTPGRPMSGTG